MKNGLKWNFSTCLVTTRCKELMVSLRLYDLNFKITSSLQNWSLWWLKKYSEIFESKTTLRSIRHLTQCSKSSKEQWMISPRHEQMNLHIINSRASWSWNNPYQRELRCKKRLRENLEVNRQPALKNHVWKSIPIRTVTNSSHSRKLEQVNSGRIFEKDLDSSNKRTAE